MTAFPYNAPITRRFYNTINSIALLEDCGVFYNAASSVAAPATADNAYFFPFTLSAFNTVVKAFWFNSANLTGNVDVGVWIADEEDPITATYLGSTGAIARAGASDIQTATLSLSLAPGKYWGGMSISDGTAAATFFAPAFASNANLCAALGWKCSTGASSPLSSSKATVTLSSFIGTSISYMPVFGFQTSTSGLA